MEDHNIDRIRSELEEARQILHQTVAEVQQKVHQKVETVTQQLEPEHLVERHFLVAACFVGALGFAIGNCSGKPALAVLILALFIASFVLDDMTRREPKWDPPASDPVEP